MIHLRLRTEYSFGRAFGRPEQVLAAAGEDAAGITDSGTWGHVAFSKAAKAAGMKPLLGVELLVVADLGATNEKGKRLKQGGASMAFLARNGEGLREIYQLVTRAGQQFYYTPRLSYDQVNSLSHNVIVLSGTNADFTRLARRDTVYLEFNPVSTVWNRKVAEAKGWKKVICCDNLYPTTSDRHAYEILAWRERRSKTTIMHIADEWELRLAVPEAGDDAFDNTHLVAEMCDVELPKAEMVRYPREKPLLQMCLEGARRRGLSLRLDPYRARLERELNMIREKNFEDYFYVIADMVNSSKKLMFVGPARGSSAGSLVCYLLGITDVDPIVHGLMFERFIDVTRADLPDIDIDFPEDKRDLAIALLGEKYGAERVGRLGTVMRYKAKSTLDDVGRELNIPVWELKDLKNSVVERSGGDARAQFCILDTLESSDIGRRTVEKYPALKIATEIEGHAKTSGTHAAGVVVTEAPLTNYCSISHDGTAQIDKHDAEQLNILKIDALGLRTLSVLHDCLTHIGWTVDDLIEYPLDDEEAFEILNAEKYSGVFQFEGYALQALCKQMKVRDFNDIVAITSLARPGPLHCGAANEFVLRRIGAEEVIHLHPLVSHLTEESYGTVIYQEQVMAIGRVMGQLSWEDVSALRKAMSKSLGEEFFNRYWEMFRKGALAQGVPEIEAKRVWDKICTFGSWAFNKSHAVSYGLISYWCAMLKARYPLEFGAACLRNAKDSDQSIKILRELVKEGYEYVPVDPKRSGLTWEVIDGKLVGGLINVHGIGTKTAQDILARRAEGKGLTPGVVKKLMNPVTPFDDIFEGERRFGDYYTNPRAHGITSGEVSYIRDILEPGEYVFIARMQAKNQRDLNEHDALAKRGGRKILRNNLFLNLNLEDDTGSIIATVNRYDYVKWGKPLVENHAKGEWFLWKGKISNEWRVVRISRWKALEEKPASGAPTADE